MLKKAFLCIVLCYCFPVSLWSVQSLDQSLDLNKDALKMNKPKTEESKKKMILKEKYRNLEEQHMVVMVLAKQYNKELAELRSKESLFCNYFDLDVDKWRKNMYIWDDQTEIFLERSPSTLQKNKQDKNLNNDKKENQ